MPNTEWDNAFLKTFSPEEVEKSLRDGTWTTLSYNSRVCWSHERGPENMSVRSYLRRIGCAKEARQLWDQQKQYRR
jgi:hypothetical protein